MVKQTQLISFYSDTGFVAFMSMMTMGIIVYLAIITLCEKLFQKSFSSGWKYGLSLAVPVFLLIPVRISVPWSKLPLVWFNFPLYIKSPDPVIAEEITEVNHYSTFTAAEGEFLYSALFYIWLTGAVITFSYQMIKLRGLYRTIKIHGQKCTDERYLSVLKSICENKRIRQPELLVLPQTDTPFAVGIIHPKVILTDESCSEREMYYILSHEMTHICRKDILLKLFLMIFRCVNWFDPFVYYMIKKAGSDIEITCDEIASESFTSDEREEYSKTIVKQAWGKRYPAVTTYLSSSASLSKKRIDAVMNVRRSGAAIPFVISFISVLMCSQVFYAYPDDGNQAYHAFIVPYPIESDPYIITDDWKICEADSYSEAAEKIFRQYMDMYIGDDVPDYYRIEDYYITDSGSTELTQTIDDIHTFGLFTDHRYGYIEYCFMPYNKCGNTVHNKNFGLDWFENGVYFRCFMDMELKKDGRSYRLTNIGFTGTGGTEYHFKNTLAETLTYASALAQSGLLDYSWNNTDALPEPQDICEFEYLYSKMHFDKDGREMKESDLYFPDRMSKLLYYSSIKDHLLTAECKYQDENGVWMLDTSELFYDESRKFVYCGSETDLENASTVIFGNAIGNDVHGIKIYIDKNNTENESGRYIRAVEVCDSVFDEHIFNDSFSRIDYPADIVTAVDILEYMKTPRDGCDFTILDYRNITEESDGTYAEVRFKGRLDGQYSSDILQNTDDCNGYYIKTKVK